MQTYNFLFHSQSSHKQMLPQSNRNVFLLKLTATKGEGKELQMLETSVC